MYEKSKEMVSVRVHVCVVGEKRRVKGHCLLKWNVTVNSTVTVSRLESTSIHIIIPSTITSSYFLLRREYRVFPFSQPFLHHLLQLN